MSAYGSVSGLVSGIQTDELIAKIMSFRARPVNILNNQKAALTEKLTTWQNVNTRLLAVQMSAVAIANRGAFSAKSVSSSNSNALTASAASTALPGTYTFRVTQLARAHQLASDQSFSDTNTQSVGTGVITITNVKTGTSKVIGINAGQDTLEGVRAAINASGGGFTANIINDGSGTPFRLLITSKETGSNGELHISTQLTGGAGLSFEGAGAVISPPDNAIIQFGSGSTPITVTSSTNFVQNTIPGVTLNLLAVTGDTPVTVTVEDDTSGIIEKIKAFIQNYNDFASYVKEVTRFDPELKTGGPLLGDFALQGAMNDITSLFNRSVLGLSGQYASLSGVGITLAGDGKLVLDESRLRSALTQDPNAVTRLFARTGTTTNSSVTFLAANNLTKASPAGYAIHITQAATQARLTSGRELAETLGQNENISLNGVSIQLTAGMSRNEVVAAINSRSASTGVTASLTGIDGTGTGNYLSFRYNEFGSVYNIRVISNIAGDTGTSTGIGMEQMTLDNPAGDSGLGTAERGKDVAGTINGEKANGVGRTLTGDSSNRNTAGLAIMVNSTATGDMGSVTYTQGVGAGMVDLLARMTNEIDGTLTATAKGVQNQISELDRQMNTLVDRIAAEENRLKARFAALEASLGRLQSQSQFLTANLQAMNSARSSK